MLPIGNIPACRHVFTRTTLIVADVLINHKPCLHLSMFRIGR
jgi:hypothetical protein